MVQQTGKDGSLPSWELSLYCLYVNYYNAYSSGPPQDYPDSPKSPLVSHAMLIPARCDGKGKQRNMGDRGSCKNDRQPLIRARDGSILIALHRFKLRHGWNMDYHVSAISSNTRTYV